MYVGNRPDGTPIQIIKTLDTTGINPNAKPGSGSRLADRELARMVSEVTTGRLGRGTIPIDQLLERWLAQLGSLGRSPTTMREYRAIAARSVVPVIGQVSVSRLTASRLDKLNAKAGRGWAVKQPKTRQARHIGLDPLAINTFRLQREWVDDIAAQLAMKPFPDKFVLSPSPPAGCIDGLVDRLVAHAEVAGDGHRRVLRHQPLGYPSSKLPVGLEYRLLRWSALAIRPALRGGRLVAATTAVTGHLTARRRRRTAQPPGDPAQ